MSLFDLFLSYVLFGDAKAKFVWLSWISKKELSLLSMLAKMLFLFFRGNSVQLGSLCQACTRRLRIINFIFMGFSYNGMQFLILQKADFRSDMVMGDAFQFTMMPYRAIKSSMDYNPPLCVFQQFLSNIGLVRLIIGIEAEVCAIHIGSTCVQPKSIHVDVWCCATVSNGHELSWIVFPNDPLCL